MEEQIAFYEFSIKKAATNMSINQKDNNVMQLAQILPREVSKLAKELN